MRVCGQHSRTRATMRSSSCTERTTHRCSRGERPQHVFPARDVQRKIAVAPVVAVEETTLLVSMQRVIGRVEVQHHLFGRLRVLDKQIDQQRIKRFAVRDDFLVPVLGGRLRLPQLQTVQRARPRQRMTAVALTHPSFPPHILALQRQRQHAVVAKPVVIIEILVAQGHPLPNERLHTVLGPALIAVVGKAPRQSSGQIQHSVRRAKQHRAAVRRHRPPVELADDFTPSQPFKRQIGRITRVCMGFAPWFSVTF